MVSGMTTRKHRTSRSVSARSRKTLDDVLDPQELASIVEVEERWIERLRMDRAHRTSFDFFDHVEQLAY